MTIWAAARKHQSIYDYKQMFDGMDAKQAGGDICEYGVNDDHLNLIFISNKEAVRNVREKNIWTKQGL